MSSPVVPGPDSGPRIAVADVGAAPADRAVLGAADVVGPVPLPYLDLLGGASRHGAAGELLHPPGPAPLRKGLSG